MPPRGVEQSLQPPGMRERVGIEQRDVFGFTAHDGAVVGGGKAKVLVQLHHLRPARKPRVIGAASPGVGDRPIGAAVVHHENADGRDRLRRDAFQATNQQVAPVVIDHDDRDGDRIRRRIGVGAARG
jgi:hypothetical protein